jgi:hypothetical protein
MRGPSSTLERGAYENWAPFSGTTARRAFDIWYDLGAAAAALAAAAT